LCTSLSVCLSGLTLMRQNELQSHLHTLCLSHTLFFSPSLLTCTTHTHTHTLSLSLSHTHTHTRQLTHAASLSFCLFLLSVSLSLSHSLSIIRHLVTSSS